MKTKSSVIAIANLIIAMLVFINVDAHSTEKNNFNFNVSTSNIYSPGDQVTLSLYSYTYQEDLKTVKFNFDIFVYRIMDIHRFYSLLKAKSSYDILGADSSNLLFLTKEVETIGRTYTDNSNYEYKSIYETITLNTSDKGAYLVKVISGQKVAYCGFIISELGLITKAGNNSLLAFAVDRKSGNPVNNAKLDFYIGSRKIGSSVTNEGIAYQSFSQSDLTGEFKSPLVIGEMGENVIISDPYLYFNQIGNKYYVYTYTNQPVYRTNSQVEFKGTIRTLSSGEYQPYSSKEISVIIKDASNAEIYKSNLQTNSNGSYNGSFKLDANAALGTYHIYTIIDDKNTYSSSFTVEQYKKPEYKVEVSTDKAQYLGNDQLTGTVKAAYYFGSPLNGGDVEYNIYRIRYYRPWWLNTKYAWWYEDYYSSLDENQQFSGAEQIYTGHGKLDSEGKFNFDYTINQLFTEDNYNYWYWRRGESDYKYIIQAKVTDKSRREISGTTTVFVTRGAFTISARTGKYWYKPGESVKISVNATDFGNNPVSTDFKAEVYKILYTPKYNHESDKKLITTLHGSTNEAGDGTVSYNLPSDEEGSFIIKIIATDSKGNEITTDVYFYVSSGDFSWWNHNESTDISLMTDKESYKVGEKCGVFIFTPVPDPNILVTTENDDIIDYKVVKLTGTTYFYEFAVTENYGTNFNVSVNFVHDGDYYTNSIIVPVIREDKFLNVNIETTADIFKPKDKEFFRIRVTDYKGAPVKNAEVSVGIIDESIYAIKPDNTKDVRKFFYGPEYSGLVTRYSSGQMISNHSRFLNLMEAYNIRSFNDPELATVFGRITDANGNPVIGMSIVIDNSFIVSTTNNDGNFSFKIPEGEYELGYGLPGLEYFKLKEIELDERSSLKIDFKINAENVAIIKEEQLFKDGDLSAPRLSDFNGRDGSEVPMEESTMKTKSLSTETVEPDVRSDFRDAILWSPNTITDENGYADLEIQFPDNLTEWRITSRVITADTKVGQNVRTVITRKDLLVRMETPRFFRQGDEVTISAIVHNYLADAKETAVRFKTENLIFNGESEKTITLQPNQDTRIDWKVRVDQPTGEAKLYVEALTDEESDAVELKVPLQPRGLRVTQSAIVDFDDLNKTEFEYINIPEHADIRTTRMKFTVSPSLASTILSSLDELAGYPYGCVEQTMSRFLPTVVVAKAFRELNAPLNEVTQKNLPEFVSVGLQRLYGFQKNDGSWGWWYNDDMNPFMTAYVLYGFSIANESGYNVNHTSFSKGINALKVSLKSDMDPTTRAYVNYVLAYSGNSDLKTLEGEYNKISGNKSDYTLSLMALAFELAGDHNRALELVNLLESQVQYSGEGAAYWETMNPGFRWQDDKVQATAMALKALMNIKSDSELKNKVVRWLMTQRRGLSWRSTQETAFIIFAMVDYLKNSDELSPDYEVKVFVNNVLKYEKQMTESDVFSKENVILLDYNSLVNGANEIRIEKSGKGKVYFSSGIDYYLNDASVLSRENGFRVEREYYKLEKYEAYNSDKITYRKKYFDGTLKSGDYVLVKLKVSAKEPNTQYFMIEDPIPSGTEVIKDDWQFTIEEETNYAGYDHYWWRWWYADKDIWDDRVTFFATYLYGDTYEFSYILRAQIPGEYSVNPSQGMLMYYPEVYGSTDEFKLSIID